MARDKNHLRAVDDREDVPMRAATLEETFEECKSYVTHALQPVGSPPLRRPAWGDRRFSVCTRCGAIREDVYDVNYQRIGSPLYHRPPGWAEWNAKMKDDPHTHADWVAAHMRTLRRRMREGD